MPMFIPKPEEQVTYFQGVLEHGEQVQAAFWCEQRLFWLVHWLIEELPLGEIIFMSLRHRYFAALTDRRLILMGRQACTSRSRPSSSPSSGLRSRRRTSANGWAAASAWI